MPNEKEDNYRREIEREIIEKYQREIEEMRKNISQLSPTPSSSTSSQVKKVKQLEYER